MLSENQKVFKITAAGTNTVVNKTCYFLALIASAVTPGTLGITIQDKATSAVNKLLPAIDLTPPVDHSGPLVKDYTPPQPVRMEGGIDIVTATGGTGEAYLWIWYLFEPDPQL